MSSDSHKYFKLGAMLFFYSYDHLIILCLEDLFVFLIHGNTYFTTLCISYNAKAYEVLSNGDKYFTFGNDTCSFTSNIS